VSLRSAPVQAPSVTPAGIAGAAQAQQRVLGLASSTLVAFQRQNLIAQQATDDLYFTSVHSDATTKVSQVYTDNPNPEVANQKATAYLDELYAQAPEKYRERLRAIGTAINNQQLVKSRNTFSKNLQRDQAEALDATKTQLIDQLKTIDISTPEGQTLAGIYYQELDDLNERQIQSEILQKGYQTPEQVELVERKYAVERQTVMDEIQTSQLVAYAVDQDDMIGFISAVQQGDTGVQELDNLPMEIKLKAGQQVKQVYDLQVQQEAYAEKQQEAQREQTQLVVGEQLVSMDPTDPRFAQVSDQLILTGGTFSERQKLRSVVREIQTAATQTDPQVKLGLVVRVYSGEGADVQREIATGEHVGRLSAGDMKALYDIAAGQKNEFFNSAAMKHVKTRIRELVGDDKVDPMALLMGQDNLRVTKADILFAESMEIIEQAYKNGEIESTQQLHQFVEQNVYAQLKERMALPENEEKPYSTVQQVDDAFMQGQISVEEYERYLQEVLINNE
jgi:hypothetical protein